MENQENKSNQLLSQEKTGREITADNVGDLIFYKKGKKKRTSKKNGVQSKPSVQSSNMKKYQGNIQKMLSEITGAQGMNIGGSGLETNETTISSALNSYAVQDIKELIEASAELYKRSGVYTSFMDFIGSMLTLNHFIFPSIRNEETRTKDDFVEASKIVAKYDIKNHFSQFVLRCLIFGASYQYKLENEDKIDFQFLQWENCRIVSIQDGVARVGYNLESLDEEYFETGYYPQELEDAWKRFETSQESMIESGEVVYDIFYVMSDRASAFTLDTEVLVQEGVSRPPFSSSLIDLLRLENAKNGLDDLDALENAKILHSKIETDKDGKLLMDMNAIMAFRDMVDQTLPEGIDIVTTPFNTDTLNFGSSVGNQGRLNLVQKHRENAHHSLGVNPMLFAAGATSGESLRAGINRIQAWLFSKMIPQLQTFMNYELRTHHNENGIWRLTFMRQTWMNRQESIDNAKEMLAMGGSRLRYLAVNDEEPINVANVFRFEQEILDIDSLLIPKGTSYTMSGEDEGGRPQEDEISDSTDGVQSGSLESSE